MKVSALDVLRSRHCEAVERLEQAYEAHPPSDDEWASIMEKVAAREQQDLAPGDAKDEADNEADNSKSRRTLTGFGGLAGLMLVLLTAVAGGSFDTATRWAAIAIGLAAIISCAAWFMFNVSGPDIKDRDPVPVGARELENTDSETGPTMTNNKIPRLAGSTAAGVATVGFIGQAVLHTGTNWGAIAVIVILACSAVWLSTFGWRHAQRDPARTQDGRIVGLFLPLAVTSLLELRR